MKVVLVASTNSGTISLVSVPGASAAIFIALASFAIVNGNAQNFYVHVHNSKLQFNSLFNCPSEASLRFTSSAVEIVFIPGIVTAAVFDINDSEVALDLFNGLGGTPALTASMSAGGSWDANFVGVMGTVSQKVAYAGLPAVIAHN